MSLGDYLTTFPADHGPTLGGDPPRAGAPCRHGRATRADARVDAAAI